MTETELIQGCKALDRLSQFELVKQYSGMLMTICRRYAPNEFSAQDILQESFIQIFSNIDSYQPTGSFKGWIKVVTVNCALQWLRKRNRFTQNLTFEVQDAGEEIPEIFLQMDEEHIIQMIQSLPVGYRLVFNLNVIEGYSHKEIGEKLNIEESASRSQLTRAKKILRKKILEKKMNYRII